MRVENIRSSSILQIGCGAVGTVLATHLCMDAAVDELVLADIDVHATRRAVTQARSSKARGMSLDASDLGQLTQAMKGRDLVVNSSLPRFNQRIKEAALAAGIDYMDLATESSDPYVDDRQWKDAGRTALLGMGEDPGLSNVFARAGANGRESLESVRIRDGDTGSSPESAFVSLFSPESFIEETTTPSRIWRDGRYETVPPFGAHEVFGFPPPLGPLSVYSVDHEEVDSLPRYLGKGVQYVDFKLSLDEPTVRKLKEFQDLKNANPAPEDFARARRAFLASIPKPADLAGRVTGYSGVFVEVKGSAGGRAKVHTFFMAMSHPDASRIHGATATAYLTGTGAAAGALLLATGRVKETGVIPPESLDPTPVLAMVRDRGIEIVEQVKWEPAGG